MSAWFYEQMNDSWIPPHLQCMEEEEGIPDRLDEPEVSLNEVAKFKYILEDQTAEMEQQYQQHVIREQQGQGDNQDGKIDREMESCKVM